MDDDFLVFEVDELVEVKSMLLLFFVGILGFIHCVSSSQENENIEKKTIEDFSEKTS